jgi:hypothetical protein
MFEKMLFLLLATLCFLWARRLFRKRKNAKKTDAKAPKSAIELWAEEIVALELGKKLGTDRELVLKALRGEPEPETVGSMEQSVKAIQLAYERMTQPNEAEVRVELSFEDGSSHVARKRVSWQEMPEVVRDEFARTGGSRVYRPFHFPWADPDAS